MDKEDMADPKHESAPTEATPKAPRTDIEDLAPPADELSEEEAAQVVGGLVVNAIIATPIALLVPDTSTRFRAFTTGGNPYPDQDTVRDQE